MFIFNPVIEDKSPNCRCKDCLHAFWYRINTERNYLICNCDLMHSVTFPNESEKSLPVAVAKIFYLVQTARIALYVKNAKVLYGILPTSTNSIAIVYIYKN